MKLSRSVAVFALKLLAGFAVMAFVLMRVDMASVLAAARSLTPIIILAAVLVYFSAHIVNAAKLRLLLPQLSYWQAWRFTMIGVLYGTALPGQVAGDAVKALRLARAADNVGDMGAAVAAVAVDKVIGMFALLVLMALSVGWDAPSFDPRVAAAAVVVTAFAALGLFLLLGTALPSRFGRWGQGFTLWRSAALTPAVLIKSLALGLVFQSLAVADFIVLAQGLAIHLAPTVWAVVVGLVSVVLLLPVTVAGIGLRDGSLVAVLGMLGQSQAAALALSLSLLAVNLLGAAVGFIVDLAGHDRDAKPSSSA